MIFHDWKATEIIPNPLAWYQYQPGGSAGQVIYDSIGDKHLTADVANAPILTTNVLNGYPAWYFNGTRDPLVWSGLVTIKHAFIVASAEDATFAGYQGLFTGETLGDVLVGENATDQFFDLSLTGFEYTKNGTVYANNDQQAPVSGAFALLEAQSVPGITLDGIQIGQQKADTARLWKGHFVEMILFDRILNATEHRRVRNYFATKFGLWRQGLPLYFPSADITPTVGPSRFLDVPPDYSDITDSWEYEDAVRDFNEVAADPPMHWEYAYPAVPKAHLPIYNEFWNQARLVNPFYFRDPEGLIWDNVRVEAYNRNHEGHKRWKHDVAFRLVGYNSTATPEPVPTPPTPPTDLTLMVLSDSSIEATWGLVLDITAPSVPTMNAGSVISGTEIDWSWSASTDDTAVTGYDLQVALDSGFTSGLVTHNLGNVLAYSSTGLTSSTTYYARVRAHDAAPNSSAYSSSVNATTSSVGDTDAQAFLTAAGITDPTISSAIDGLVVALKAASIWTKMLAIYPFVGGTSSTNKWNLKNPLDTDAAYRLTFTGGLTHTNGLLPDGSTGYANTHFDPQTKATLDSHHLSIYSNTNNTPPGSDSVDIGAYDGGGTNVGSLSIRGTGTKDTLVGRLWSTNVTSANASALGFFCVSRTSSSNTEIYKNGTSQAAGSGAGALLINATVYFIGNRNDNGSGYINGWTNQNYVFASIGTGLNDTEASDLRTAVEAFEVALSREA